jgi:hypothetical protein
MLDVLSFYMPDMDFCIALNFSYSIHCFYIHTWQDHCNSSYGLWKKSIEVWCDALGFNGYIVSVTSILTYASVLAGTASKDIIRKVEKFLRCKRKKRVIIWKAPQMPN